MSEIIPEKDRKEYFNKADLTKEPVFADLYDYFAPKLLRHAQFRLNGSEEAKDVVAQTFFKTWQYLQEDNPRTKIKNVKAFLYQLANNLIIDIYRQKPKAVLSLEGLEPEAIIVEFKAVELIQDQFDVQQLFQISSQLREDYRQVITLRYLDECSIAEMADILGRTKGSVSVLLFRAVRELRKILKEKKFQ